MILVASVPVLALLVLIGNCRAAESSWILKHSKTQWVMPIKADRPDIPYYYQKNIQAGTPVYIGPAQSEGYPPPPTGYISHRLFNH